MVLALLAEGTLGPAPCTPALQTWVSPRQTLLYAPPPTALPAGLASEASHPVAVSANALLCAAALGPSLGPRRPLRFRPLGWILGGQSDSHRDRCAESPGGRGQRVLLAAGRGSSSCGDSTPDLPSTPHGHSWRKARLTLRQETRLSITMPPATLGKFTENQFPERQFVDGQVSN